MDNAEGVANGNSCWATSTDWGTDATAGISTASESDASPPLGIQPLFEPQMEPLLVPDAAELAMHESPDMFHPSPSSKDRQEEAPDQYSGMGFAGLAPPAALQDPFAFAAKEASSGFEDDRLSRPEPLMGADWPPLQPAGHLHDPASSHARSSIDTHERATAAVMASARSLLLRVETLPVKRRRDARAPSDPKSRASSPLTQQHRSRKRPALIPLPKSAATAPPLPLPPADASAAGAAAQQGTVHPLVPAGYLDPQRHVKGSTRLHPEQVGMLKAWMAHHNNWLHPYPSEDAKQDLANCTGLRLSQVSDWFRNERKRTWLPLCRAPGSSLGKAVQDLALHIHAREHPAPRKRTPRKDPKAHTASRAQPE